MCTRNSCVCCRHGCQQQHNTNLMFFLVKKLDIPKKKEDIFESSNLFLHERTHVRTKRTDETLSRAFFFFFFIFHFIHYATHIHNHAHNHSHITWLLYLSHHHITRSYKLQRRPHLLFFYILFVSLYFLIAIIYALTLSSFFDY